MHVDHLLRLDRLDLSLVWGDESLLGQEIAGVTATDLEDPERFLQPGEVVLSGLVWWTPDGAPAKTDHFVSALRRAGAVALLAGEETHGHVPRELADACRTHRVALIAVPPHTSFRAITEAVYLRQWGELSRHPTGHHALPENVRLDLDRALESGATTGELLDRAFAHLGSPACHLLTAGGRTVTRTGAAAELTARAAVDALRGGQGTTLRVEAESTDFDTWYLHLPEEGQVPPRVLQEISELLGRHRRRLDRHRAARGPAAARLVEAIGALRVDTDHLRGALASCGLGGRTAYAVVVASLEPNGDAGADGVAALTEALGHLRSVAFAVAPCAGDEVAAVLAHETDTTEETAADTADATRDRLREVWPLVQACRPESTWQAGISAPVATPAGLNTALKQARYALAAARTATRPAPRVAGLRDLDGLALLLGGIPDAVREVYRETVLGPLLNGGRSGAMLLDTLEVFLAHDCSWTRTAEALHIHVNTVHYRVERIETLTGRDLSRLDDRVDLSAALLCR
ncbi:PucR family transcriptional regulator [Streptomyces sp. NBC_00233]|uniref:PucR family transcriptional regulator n=1 Tax=Streptomyces sp. NBC_00233 TaxID=2975686 RepID=UPI00224FAB09|nr:PucR family transcriptional regulator [Streptomyces sp. NBC_00233]MCX5229530.1 helix-turn-helix domain-containing protein [Streptomyces sp. NBC_00233]